jgi:hypothetical protein
MPHFLGGFLYGMTAENHLQEIEACYSGAEIMYPEIEFALAELAKGGWDNEVQAILEFGIVVLQVPQALHTCENMGDDLAAIGEWAQIFLNPKELTATVTKHYALHRKAIQADIAADKAHWAAEEWWQAGIVSADLMTLAIGPINPVYPTDMVSLAPLAVPDFVAGLIYGFTGDNDLEELEACYNGGIQVQVDAENLLADLKNMDVVQAYKHVQALKTDLKDATTKCTGMDEDLARIEAWAEIFTNPKELTITVSKNWLLHKRGIEKDIAQEKVDWAAGNYFSAGVDTADALVKLIGPVA